MRFKYLSLKNEISFQYTLIIQVMTPVPILPYYTELNVGQFGPWTIRTLVNSDLIRTSARVNSDLGRFGP